MFHRIALAALLIGFLAVSANAQKDKPKPAMMTWETVAADKASKMTTKRASVPGGWLVLVQSGDDLCLTFFPDPGHRWSADDGSPSDTKPLKPKFEDATKPILDKLKTELEQARAAALAERGKTEAALRKAEEERKRALEQLEKTKKEKRSKKAGKADGDAGKETQRKRIDEALGLAAREEADKARAIAEQARAQEAAARHEAQALKEKLEGVARQFQKQLAETTKALDEARTAGKRAAVEVATAMEDGQRLKAENELLKKENDRLKQLLDKKKK